MNELKEILFAGVEEAEAVIIRKHQYTIDVFYRTEDRQSFIDEGCDSQPGVFCKNSVFEVLCSAHNLGCEITIVSTIKEDK